MTTRPRSLSFPALGLLLLAPTLALAQPPKAGVVTTLQGQVTVARAGLPQPIPLKFKDDVFLRDRITTQEHAIARVLLGGKALVTIRELSVFTITEEPGRAVVDLQRGRLALAVAERLLRPGEAVEVRTPHAIAAVRGSLSVIEVTNPTRIWHLQGKPLALLTPDRRPLTSLDPGQKLSASPLGLGPKEAIPPGEASEVAKTHQDTPKPKEQTDKAPELLARKVSGEKMQEAAELATRLAPAEVLAKPETRITEPTPIAETSTEDLGVQAKTATEAAATAAAGTGTSTETGTPEVLVSGGTRTLGATESLKTFSGTSSRSATAPVVKIASATVTGPGPASVIKVSAGANATLAGPLALVDPSTVNTTNSSFNSLLTTVGVGDHPRAVAITPDGARAYVANQNSNNVSVIDTATNTVVATVGVGDGPAGIAITPDGARAYVANRSSNNVSVIDTATNTVVATVALAGLVPLPTGVATSPDGARAYVADAFNGNVRVIDTATNTVIATLDMALVIGHSRSPLEIAITPDGSRAYVTDEGGSKKVDVIDTATNSVIATVDVGNTSEGVAITPDGTHAYVAVNIIIGGGGGRAVKVIDTATNTVIATVATPIDPPRGVAITPDGTRAYVTLEFEKVIVIDTATNTVVATVDLGLSARPDGIAITPDGTRAYVGDFFIGNVSVLDTNPGAHFLDVAAGGTIVSTGTGSLIKFDASTVTIGGSIAELAGRSTATAPDEVVDGVGVPLTLGTDKPLQHNGVVVELSGSTVTARKGIRLDPALFEASAPLLDLKATSTLTTNLEAIDLSLKAKVTSLGPVLRLDASTLTVQGGAAINVNAGSLLKVTGDLLQLSNASTLNVNNGPLVRVAAGSVLNVSGALVAFGDSGGNTIKVTNTLCPCTSFSGIPVALKDGAVPGNVSIGANPIKNASLGTLNPTSASAAVILVSGATSKVTITAP